MVRLENPTPYWLHKFRFAHLKPVMFGFTMVRRKRKSVVQLFKKSSYFTYRVRKQTIQLSFVQLDKQPCLPSSKPVQQFNTENLLSNSIQKLVQQFNAETFSAIQYRNLFMNSIQKLVRQFNAETCSAIQYRNVFSNSMQKLVQ